MAAGGKALKAEGCVVLINSNRAIMTDPDTADRTYVGPMAPSWWRTSGQGRRDPAHHGRSGGAQPRRRARHQRRARHHVELIGAKLDAINKAEDRELFKQAMDKLGFFHLERADHGRVLGGRRAHR